MSKVIGLHFGRVVQVIGMMADYLWELPLGGYAATWLTVTKLSMATDL
jgi:hypothetical protein